MTTQLALPGTDLRPFSIDVALDRLPPDEDLMGPPPDKAFVESVRRVDVLHPILIEGVPDDPLFQVWAGARRIKAARIVGRATVPARLYPRGSLSPDLVTIIENAHRSDNALRGHKAVENLRAALPDDAAICAATGLTLPELRARAKLDALHPALLAAARMGRIKETIALDAARLSTEDQEALAALLARNGKLTTADVKEARLARKSAEIASLSPRLFETPGIIPVEPSSAGEEEPSDWRAALDALLTRALTLVPPDQARLRAQLSAAQGLLAARSA